MKLNGKKEFIKMFKQGEIVEHILEKEWVMVLHDDGIEDHTVLCRTKGLHKEDFYRFELRSKR